MQLCLYIYKALYGMAPDYIKERCVPALVTERREKLRSTVLNTERLTLPTQSTTLILAIARFGQLDIRLETANPSILDNHKG